MKTEPLIDSIERVAIACSRWVNGFDKGSPLWGSLSPEQKAMYHEQAKAAITAMGEGNTADLQPVPDKNAPSPATGCVHSIDANNKCQICRDPRMVEYPSEITGKSLRRDMHKWLLKLCMPHDTAELLEDCMAIVTPYITLPEPVSGSGKAAKIFRDGLSKFQKEFWDSYYFPPQGQFNIAEMQRLDGIIINALIEGDEA